MIRGKLLIPLLIALLSFHETKAISLAEAVKKGWVETRIYGEMNEQLQSSHYGQCMRIEMKNLLDHSLEVKLETGRLLPSNDTIVQDMMVTKQVSASLAPGKKESYGIYAMCVQASKSAPGESRFFSIGNMARADWVKLAHFIEGHELQNELGQTAVWVLSNNYPLEDLCYAGNDNANLLRTFFEQDLSRNVPDCTFASQPAKRLTTYKGAFSFYLPKTTSVEIAVYDKDNKKIKEILKEAALTTDYYDYSFEFTNKDFAEGESYYVRLLLNGVPRKELVIEN